jgi:hypothetical protein
MFHSAMATALAVAAASIVTMDDFQGGDSRNTHQIANTKTVIILWCIPFYQASPTAVSNMGMRFSDDERNRDTDSPWPGEDDD